MEYIIINAQFHSWYPGRRIASVIDNKNGKSMTNHCANIENIANVVEYIKNMDPKQFANVRDEVFEVFEEIEVDFEEIMGQDSDEEMLSWLC